MEPIPASLIPQIIQDLNTCLGIIGFFITLYVTWQVKSIRRSFSAKARLPQISKDLKKAGSQINIVLSNWPQERNEGHAKLKLASSLIEGALVFAPRAIRRKLKVTNKKLILAIKDFAGGRFDHPDPMWDLYSDIQVVITVLDQVEENLKWE